MSTGAWIENDRERTRAGIATWRERPDYASVNLSEPDAPAVMAQLRRVGIGIEAGLASPADAERLVTLAGDGPLLRVLIKVEEQDPEQTAAAMAAVLEHASLRRPILAHGYEASVWPMVEMAGRRRWSTRVGLEDGQRLPDGRVATDDAALVAAAFKIIDRVV